MNATTHAAEVHRQSPVLLAHVHMQRKFTPTGIDVERPEEDVPGRQVDIPKLHQGGVKYIWLSEGAPGEFKVDAERLIIGKTQPNTRPITRTVYHGPSEVQRMLRGWDATVRLCQSCPEHLELALSVGHARDIVSRGKVAVFWASEILLIANDLAMLRAYHALGMRVCGLAHAAPLDWVDTDMEQRAPGGLTDLGRQVVREMNALGMVIDVSHASEQAIYDVLRASSKPIVASHSNAKALSPLMRNLSDDVIRAIARAGGVIGIHCSSAFVDIRCLHQRQPPESIPGSAHNLDMMGRILTPGAIEPFAHEAQERAARDGPPAGYFPTVSLARLIDVVDYIVSLTSVDSVGVGTDFLFLEDPVVGFQSVAEAPDVTEALLERGYSDDAVAKIMGGNLLRVMEDVIGQ